MTFWKTQHFKAMQQAWYAKLREQGFEDAEVMIGEEMVLRQSAAHPYRHEHGELEISAKEVYYSLISQHLQDSVFRNDVDHLIISLHAEGYKIHRIVEALEAKGKPRCRKTVLFTIRKYEMKWGLREYTPRQLNKKTG